MKKKGYGLDGRGKPSSDLRQGQNNYCILQRTVHRCGPPSVQLSGFLGLKQPECQAEHSPPPSAKVKNGRSFTSTQYAFVASTVTT